MLARDVMQAPVATVTPDATLPEAVRLAGQRGIRHLPVVERRRLVGIISDRDLKRAMASSATSLEAHELRYLLDRVRVREIMTRDVRTTWPSCPVEEAASLMVRERVGALPVLEDGQLVGILTETDVLALFVRAMGAGAPSSRLDVPLGPRPTAMSEVVHAIEQAGTVIASIVTLACPDGAREAVVRVATIDPRPAILALRAAGYVVRDGERAPVRAGS